MVWSKIPGMAEMVAVDFAQKGQIWRKPNRMLKWMVVNIQTSSYLFICFFMYPFNSAVLQEFQCQ